jgi:hypothetical protein
MRRRGAFLEDLLFKEIKVIEISRRRTKAFVFKRIVHKQVSNLGSLMINKSFLKSTDFLF